VRHSTARETFAKPAFHIFMTLQPGIRFFLGQQAIFNGLLKDSFMRSRHCSPNVIKLNALLFGDLTWAQAFIELCFQFFDGQVESIRQCSV
jgi:hypothetical protein